MAEFNLLSTSLTDLYQEVDPLEFSQLDTLDSASLSQLDSIATQHLLQPQYRTTNLDSPAYQKDLVSRLDYWLSRFVYEAKGAGRETISRTLERNGKRL